MNDRFKFRYFYDGKLYDVLSIDFRRKNIDFKKDEMTLIHLESEFNDKNLIQCTGLKDKNGKLIYEGDILKSSRGNTRVDFDNIEACFGVSNFLTVTPFAVLLNQEWEVIGNIYENKELLDERN